MGTNKKTWINRETENEVEARSIVQSVWLSADNKVSLVDNGGSKVTKVKTYENKVEYADDDLVLFTGTNWSPSLLRHKMLFWFDPSEENTLTLASNDVDIESIEDLSYQNNDSNQLSPPLRPSTGGVIGDLNAIEFDGLSVLELTDDANLVDAHFIGVFAPSGANTKQILSRNDTTNKELKINDDASIAVESTSNNWLGGGSGQVESTSGATSPFLLSVHGDQELNFYIDGFFEGSSSTRINDNAFEFNTIGSKSTDGISFSESYTGQMGEIIFFDQLPTEETRQKLEGFLGWKWGLSIKFPYEHPYRFDGTLFGFGKFWSPEELSTFAWYDAANTLSVVDLSGSVSEWKDLNGTNHANTGTPSYQMSTGVSSIGGLNVITSSAGKTMKVDYLGLVDNSQIACFGVIKQTDSIGTQDVFAHNADAVTNGRRIRMQMVDGAVTIDCRGTTRTYNSTLSLPTGVAGIVGWDSSNTNGTIDDYTLYLNGEEDSSSGLDGVNDNPTSDNNWISDTSRSFLGDIGELIILDYKPSTEERQIIEGYLAWKWGTEALLPVDHPYKSTPPLA